MDGHPTLHQSLTVYIELDASLARPVPEVAYRCSTPHCEQHLRQYDCVPFQTCPSCYGCPEIFETGRDEMGYPDLTDILDDLSDELSQPDGFIESDLTGLPANVWVYQRPPRWLYDSMLPFQANGAGTLDLGQCPSVASIQGMLYRLVDDDPDLSALVSYLKSAYGDDAFALKLGLVQHWD